MLLFQSLIALLPIALGIAVELDTALHSQERRELHSWLETAQKGDTMRQGNTVYEIVQPHDAILAKRQGTGSCPNAQYEKREILGTSLDWVGPSPLPGGCMDCFNNQMPCHIARTVGWSISETVSVGMDLGLAGKFAEDITANIGFNKGYTWTKGWDGSMSFTCDTPAGKGDRVTVRTRVGVADVRSRLCRSSCINESCQDWTVYQAKYPLKDKHGLVVEAPRCETVDSLEACMSGL